MKKENNNKKKEGKKNMKKNKGFTLVELLAVIAILAILVIMALPAVLRMYRQSRINTFQNEVRGVYKSAQQQFVSDSMLLESGQTIAYTNAGTIVSGVDIIKKLDMTGNSNFKYLVIIDVDGKVKTVKATNGTYSYAKTVSDLKVEDIDVENGNEATLDSDITDSILNVSSSGSGATNVATIVEGQSCGKTDIGCELIVGGENFYVIGSEGINTRLLAKYAINTTSNSQVTSGQTTIAFSDVGYWDGCQYSNHSGQWSCDETSVESGLLSPYNNDANPVGTVSYFFDYYTGPQDSYNTPFPYVYDENSNLYTAVNAYAEKIGIAAGIVTTGSLFKYEEISELSSSILINGQEYWLGSAKSDSLVWYMYSFIDHGYSGGAQLYSNNAIRPVIIVPTSAL